jgi:hypothetical protein
MRSAFALLAVGLVLGAVTPVQAQVLGGTLFVNNTHMA